MFNLVTVLPTASRFASRRRQQLSSRPQAGEIHGTVVAQVRDNTGPIDVLLPGVRVFVKEATANNRNGAPDTTDARGYFRIPRQSPGRYVVCAEAEGFHTSCLKDIEVAAGTALAGHIVLSPSQGAIWVA